MILLFSAGLDCSQILCLRDCPTNTEALFHLTQSTFNSNEPHEITNGRSSINNFQLISCCNSMCRMNCTTTDGEHVPHRTEWLDSDDACITHICNDGVIANHISSCHGLPCPIEHHVRNTGECCSVCSPNWASFCPEHADCDIACQFGFAVDAQRGCDFCKCARKKTDTSKAPTFKVTTSSTTTTPSLNDDAPHSVHYYFYLDPTDAATKHLLIGLAVACGVIFVACLAGIGWYFHRKVYKRIPLMSLRNSSA